MPSDPSTDAMEAAMEILIGLLKDFLENQKKSNTIQSEMLQKFWREQVLR